MTAKKIKYCMGQIMLTKVTTKEDSDIERRRGGDNQPMMKNGGDGVNGEGETITTVRVKQLANDEACQRRGLCQRRAGDSSNRGDGNGTGNLIGTVRATARDSGNRMKGKI